MTAGEPAGAAPPAIAPLGDSALTITFGPAIDLATHARVCVAAHAVELAAIAGVDDIVPAYAALTIYYDARRLDFTTLATMLPPLMANARGGSGVLPVGATHRIPVHYDGADLAAVAERAGMSPDDVVARHTAPDYRVYLLGFVPGFAYLGDVDEALALPRRAEPRRRVPAGSVAIAGRQTAVYPASTPGGWHLLGRTSVTLFDARREPPALLRVGDRVRFEAVWP